jgi:hypothetical protein
MKVNKKVSDKVIAANRANGRKSTGPRDSSASKLNAVKHGLLSKRLLLNEEEEKEFRQLLKDLELEFEPETASQEMVLQEAATSWCKLQRTHSWEMEQVANRRRSAEMVSEHLKQNATMTSSRISIAARNCQDARNSAGSAGK